MLVTVGHPASPVREGVLMALHRLASSLIGLGVAVSVLVACGEDSGERQVNVAQARVTQKEKAVTDAQSAATAAATAFCDASRTYITALDRYGDVLHQSAST